MKMKQVIVPMMLMMTCFLPSCDKVRGEGPLVSETRSASGFTGIDMGITGTLKFIPDSIYRIEISGQRNILDIIEMPVADGRLQIRFKRHENIRTHKPVEVHIHAPGINSLVMSGSGSLYIEKPFYPDDLYLGIAGSGSIDTDSLVIKQHAEVAVSGSGSVAVSQLTAKTLKISISGSGNITAGGGSLDEEDLRISGSGKMDLSEIIAQNTVIHNNGSGNARVNVNKKLDVYISGSGNIYYKGNPKINTSISGSGKLLSL